MTVSPAVRKLLAAADELLAIAKQMQAADRTGDALACAQFANEYIQTAKAFQEMDDAVKAYDDAAAKRRTP